MHENLREFCLRHRVHFEEEPQPLLGSQQAWVLCDVTGKRWVIKSRAEEDNSSELLKSLAVLHPPFLVPQPVSTQEDPFILYPYIDGRLLSDGIFERPDLLQAVDEVAGRVQAMMRSLLLAPFYQEMLSLKDPGTRGILPFADRFSAERLELASLQGKQARQREIAASFQWMRGKLSAFCDVVEAQGLWPGVPLEEYRDCMMQAFSIHVPILGSNLAHCAFHPEHLILTPDERIAVVGWQVEPRPRFYMKYTYLVWSFLRSSLPDPFDSYGKLLAEDIAGAFRKERCQVFSFCLLEQLARVSNHEGIAGRETWEQRVGHAKELFIECFRNLS